MNILRVPEHGATASGDKARPTSCEGYVTKRGHFRKSWRVRFLVVDGSNLQVSYFESRAASHPTTGEPSAPKGSFYLSSIEPHEYVVGVMGAADKPFGFKMVGHAPKKGYVELDVFVDTLADRNKWLEVARNALSAKRQLTRQAIDQSDLTAIDRDLDFGDKLLRRLKSPTLHLFSDDSRPKSTGGSKGTSPQRSHQSGGTSPSRLPPAMETSSDTGASDLERLAQALGELEVQAELLNGEAGRSSQQIERIEHHLTNVTTRVEKQTKQASATLSAGPRLF
ncbi:PH domain-like [Phytophthora cactorum]|nr:PH domain-like [Phytophthora cactorum]